MPQVRAGYTVEVDFDGDGAFDTAREQINSDAWEIQAFRGRDYPSQLVGRSTAGRLRATVHNADGKYSPFVNETPPGVDCRFRAAAAVQQQAADFDGTDDVLSMAHDDVLSPIEVGWTLDTSLLGTDTFLDNIGDGVVEVWAVVSIGTLPATDATEAVVGKWQTSDLEYRLAVRDVSGTVRFVWQVRNAADDTTTTVAADELGAPTADTVYFVHAWFDGPGDVLGVEVNRGTADTQAYADTVRLGGSDFEVGATDGGEWFDGAVLRLAVFTSEDTLLTAAQLDWLYNDGVGRDWTAVGIAGTDGEDIADTLAEWWQMDETSGDRVGEFRPFTLTQSGGVGSVDGLKPDVWRSLWAGRVATVTPEVTVGEAPQATIDADGNLIRLSDGPRIYVAPQENVATGAVIEDILDAAGFTSDEYDVDAGQSTLTNWWADDRDALEAARDVETSELGFLYERGDGVVRFADRDDRHTTLESVTVQWTLSDDDAAAGVLRYHKIDEKDPLREVFNEVVAKVRTYTAGSLEVLWTLSEVTPQLDAGESVTVWAEATTDSNDDSVAYVDPWTTPAVGTDITQSGVTDGDIGVAVEKFSTSMKITVTNNHASDPATLTLVRARGVPVVANDPIRVSAEDATSQAAYGRRTFKLEPPWLSFADAQEYAEFVIGRYKDPRPVLSVSFYANRDDEHMAAAVDAEIGDLVRVVASGNAGLGIESGFHIESIAHHVSHGGLLHEVTWELSLANPDGGEWILDTSLLGTDTILFAGAPF